MDSTIIELLLLIGAGLLLTYSKSDLSIGAGLKFVARIFREAAHPAQQVAQPEYSRFIKVTTPAGETTFGEILPAQEPITFAYPAHWTPTYLRVAQELRRNPDLSARQLHRLLRGDEKYGRFTTQLAQIKEEVGAYFASSMLTQGTGPERSSFS